MFYNYYFLFEIKNKNKIKTHKITTQNKNTYMVDFNVKQLFQ